ncbi:MAG: hypothetical protein ABFC75_05310, partial [Rectinema sp.]
MNLDIATFAPYRMSAGARGRGGLVLAHRTGYRRPMFRKTHGAGIPAGPVRKTLRVTLAVASAAALLATAIVLPGRIRS